MSDLFADGGRPSVGPARTAPPALLRAAAKAVRLAPGSRALARSRDWRDAADLAEAEIALVSFPKSGRTFVRAMTARLYQSRFGHPETDLLRFSKLRRAAPALPRLFFTHDGDAMRRPHEIGGDKSAYRHCRVALLARHPADVAISRRAHLAHRSRDAARRRLAELPLEEFVWAEQGGLPAIVAFLNGWARAKGAPRAFEIVRYEDFRADCHDALDRLARFCGLGANASEIADAVEFARIENLRRREREGYYASERMGARRSGEGGSAKVRSGKVGGYREALGPAAAARIDAYLDERLDPVFGYGRPATPPPLRPTGR